jgi:hypothetical protein
MHAMTGSWLLAKWIGLVVIAVYATLTLFVLIRFRRDFSRLRPGLILPIIVGNFVSISLPMIFENVVFTRVCFVFAQLIFIGGIVVLVRGLVQENHRSLLKADS